MLCHICTQYTKAFSPKTRKYNWRKGKKRKFIFCSASRAKKMRTQHFRIFHQVFFSCTLSQINGIVVGELLFFLITLHYFHIWLFFPVVFVHHPKYYRSLSSSVFSVGCFLCICVCARKRARRKTSIHSAISFYDRFPSAHVIFHKLQY